MPEFNQEQEFRAYRDMLLIRRFEEKAGQLYGMGLIGGFCHLYIGQEAVVIGMQMAIKPGDQVITGYRDHGHMLACGMDPKGVMAELTGRRGRLFQGQGRLDAHVFGGEGILRRAWHRRRPGPNRNRHRFRQQIPRQWQRLAYLFRRWRRQSGPGLRKLQHGQVMEWNSKPSRPWSSAGHRSKRGRGWLAGTVLGVLAVTILRNGLNVLSVDPSLQVVSVGILLITALLIGDSRSSAQESE